MRYGEKEWDGNRQEKTAKNRKRRKKKNIKLFIIETLFKDKTGNKIRE